MLKEIDNFAINVIIDNCFAKESEECERLLTKQPEEVIEAIFNKMYDKDGEENDFIPFCCTYDKLLEIVLSEGGVEETFGEKVQRKARKSLNEHNKRIKHAQRELDLVVHQLIQERRDLKKIQEEIAQVKEALAKIKTE